MTDDGLQLHGILVDIVSDCGSQFASQVREEFCSILGAQVSLSSGFHPETKAQVERTNQELQALCPTWSSQVELQVGLG